MYGRALACYYDCGALDGATVEFVGAKAKDVGAKRLDRHSARKATWIVARPDNRDIPQDTGAITRPGRASPLCRSG